MLLDLGVHQLNTSPLVLEQVDPDLPIIGNDPPIKPNEELLGSSFSRQELPSLARHEEKFVLSPLGIGMARLESGKSKLGMEDETTNAPLQRMNRMGEQKLSSGQLWILLPKGCQDHATGS